MNSSSLMSDYYLLWLMFIIISSVMDMLSNWGWDDFDKFVFVEVDFIVFWDDIEIKL